MHKIYNDPDRIKMSYSAESSIDIPVPEGLEYLPYQKAGIIYSVYNPFINVLIADEPGLGKTVEALGIINLRPGLPILIICPASLTTNWKRHLQTWLVDKISIQIINTGREELRDCDCYIISFNLTTNQIIFDKLMRKKFYYLIIDEVHLLKNSRSRRSTASFGNVKRRGLISQSRYCVSLTGTPAPNRPIELYSLIIALCPEAITKNGVVMSYETFGFVYCGGYYEGSRANFNGYSNMEELSGRLRSTFMVRRLKKHVLKDLPPKNYNLVFLNPVEGSKELVTKMSSFDVENLSKKRAAVSYEGISEMRRELGELIAPVAVEFIKLQLESRKKIVVFAHHKDCIKILEEGLKEYGLVKMVGATPKAKRQGLVDKFQSDDSCRIFLGQMQAAGVGHTLTAAYYVVMVEPDWVPGNNDQAIDRVHRIGQTESVEADFLIFEGSLAENVLKSHFKKSKNLKTIMGD